MSKYDPTKYVDLERLSVREREVVARAVEGHTDEQIAQGLGIGKGTVNTYWVRIRSKVGPLTRTEIVAGVLRREMEERIVGLRSEIAQLSANARNGEAPKPVTKEDMEPWRFLSLEYIYDAALVIDRNGTVLYANPHARAMLLAERHDLEGVPFWDLTEAEDGSDCRQGVIDFFANQAVRRTVLGLDKTYYARRRDGTKVRVTIAGEWFESPEGVIASVSLREFANGTPGHAHLM